ncbi:MAG: hypothetical protein FJ138_16705, partial [Deltaproteobacteria bacterium]|nr:hypothetical protein [Deltaproteobacteria bacterium]
MIERDYLAHYESDTYISIPEATSTPSPKRFALAARQGLRAAWQALSTLELTSVIDVELIDCPDATAALNALTDELSECVARRDRASSVHLEVYLASKDQRDALTLDRDSLSIEALMSLSTAKGEGLSLCVHRAPLTPDHARARTVKVAAVEAKYQSTTPPAASRAGSLKVTYDVTPSGTIGHVRASGIPAWDAVVELQTQLGARRTLRLGAPKSAEKPLGALVETLVARGGWPRSPEEARGLLAYDLGDQHVIMTCVRPELSTRLIEARLASLNMPTLDLSRLTSLTLGLHDAREFSLSLLDPSADQRKLRGDLGKLRALEALSREPGERLILNLDSPEGRAWSAAVARARGASARRADLVVLEANEGIAAVTQVRVIELKAFERLTQTPEPLIKQARLSAEQIAYTFSALSADGPREALRAFWWHGAGYARRAHAWQKALRDLDDRLSEHRLAELSAELWITLGRGEGAAQEHVIEITDEGEGVALRCVKVGEEEMPEVSPLAVSPLAVSAPEVSAPEVSAERPHITGASEVNRRPEFDYTAPISTVSLDVKTRPLSTTQPALPNAHPSDLPSGPRPPALPSRRGTLDLEELSLRAMSTFREFRVLAHLPTQRPYQEGPGFYVLRFKPGTGHRAQALTNYTPELKLKLGLGHDQEPRHYIDEGCVVFEVPKRDEDRYFVRIDDLLARWPASADDLCAPLGEDIAGE